MKEHSSFIYERTYFFHKIKTYLSHNSNLLRKQSVSHNSGFMNDFSEKLRAQATPNHNPFVGIMKTPFR